MTTISVMCTMRAMNKTPFDVLNQSNGAAYDEPEGESIFKDAPEEEEDEGAFQIPSELSGSPTTTPPELVGVDGMTGALSHTPFAGSTPSIPTVTPGNFCCIIGPCKHYSEHVQGTPQPEGEPLDRPSLWRVCHMFHDDEGEISLQDTNVPWCSRYSPPWWSLEGQRKKAEIKKLFAEINRLPEPRSYRVLAKLVRAVEVLTAKEKE